MKDKRKTDVERSPAVPVAALLAMCLVAWWLWPSQPIGPERLSGDVVELLVEGGKLPDGSVVTRMGHPLARAALDGLGTKLVRPRLAGYELEEVKQDSIRSSGRSAATLRKSDGTRRYMSVVSWRAPEGAFVTLGQVMTAVWTLDEHRDGFKPLDRAKSAQLCLAGLQKDQATLESLGIDGMDGDDGHFRNWNELAAFYQAVVAQGVNQLVLQPTTGITGRSV